MSDFAGRYQSVLHQIEKAAARCGRDPASIRLIAVTKTVSPDRIREAVDCGIRDIGENRQQEAQPKLDALAGLPITWHFIGRLQTNKAKKVAEAFDWVQSVDRAELAERLNQHAGSKRLPVLIEVKLHHEDTKSGAEESTLPELIAVLGRCGNLELRGLMAIPPYLEAEAVRPYFRSLRSLGERFGLSELSMGMSHDFTVAIEEGATMIRIGTALFGERGPRL